MAQQNIPDQPTVSHRAAEMEVDDQPSKYNPVPRNNEMLKIVCLTEYLYRKFYRKELFNAAELRKINLNENNDISGVLHTVHTYLRKKANVNASTRGNDNGDRNAKLETASFTIKELAEEYESLDGYTNFDFMLANPLVDMLTSFKCMWNEVRLSCLKFVYMEGGKKKEFKLGSLNLDNSANPFLTGLTFKPERRSGLVKILGPLTLCMLLAHEERYFDKLADALRNSLKLLPMHENIICTGTNTY